ncbi:CCHC-type domain-containing protein [Plasmodiophora brassicae]
MPADDAAITVKAEDLDELRPMLRSIIAHMKVQDEERIQQRGEIATLRLDMDDVRAMVLAAKEQDVAREQMAVQEASRAPVGRENSAPADTARARLEADVAGLKEELRAARTQIAAMHRPVARVRCSSGELASEAPVGDRGYDERLRAPVKIDLKECTKDPWKDREAVKTWLNGAMPLVRRRDASREDQENYVLSKGMHPALRAHVGASTWLFPTGSRDKLLGKKEARTRGSWGLAAKSLKQRDGETLTAFLPRLETALNEYRENDPDRAHDGEIYDIYLASLNAQVRGKLVTTHMLWEHLETRRTYREKISFIRECLYEERNADDAKPTKKAVVGAAGRCRTCRSTGHSWTKCQKARAQERCPGCDGAQHFRFECPKRKSSGAPTVETTTPGRPIT